MSKIHISFLGVNNYYECNYFHKKKENIVKEVRFVQEATIQLFCRDFGAADRIIVFVTEAAKHKNWYDDGHSTREGTVINQEGLERRLQRLNLSARYEMIEIKEGTDEDEIWSIFQKIYDQIQSGDEVTLDITYGFRSLPMLGIVLIHYAKMLKNIRIKAVAYGAFEALFKTGKRINQIPLEERNVPILNLTSFAMLQQWTNAARDFTLHGKAAKIAELTKQETFGEALENMTLSFSTVRGREIVEGNIFSIVKNNIEQLQDKPFVAPLSPLLEKVKQKITPFQSNDIQNGLLAVQWCIRHELIQQGITMLLEVITTFTCEILNLEDASFNLNHFETNDRWFVGTCLVINDNLPEVKWGKPIRYDKPKARKIRASQIVEDIKSHYQKLGKMRNDINHGGFNANPLPPRDFKNELERIYVEVNRILGQFNV